ncbi:MAG TPA: hypothetical protein VLW84_01060 [Terriglobales bacterium]|nr:hypothetical protein [Terriglobales bacterium]
MPQEVSISYQAVKSKVYKLIDAMVEGEKTEAEVQESMRRWWALIHPADRAVAQKYLLTVLEKTYSSLGAMSLDQPVPSLFKAAREVESGKLPKLQSRAERTHASSAI